MRKGRVTPGQKNVMRLLTENGEMTFQQIRDRLHKADADDMKQVLYILIQREVVGYRTERPTSQELIFYLKENA